MDAVDVLLMLCYYGRRLSITEIKAIRATCTRLSRLIKSPALPCESVDITQEMIDSRPDLLFLRMNPRNPLDPSRLLQLRCLLLRSGVHFHAPIRTIDVSCLVNLEKLTWGQSVSMVGAVNCTRLRVLAAGPGHDDLNLYHFPRLKEAILGGSTAHFGKLGLRGDWGFVDFAEAFDARKLPPFPSLRKLCLQGYQYRVSLPPVPNLTHLALDYFASRFVFMWHNFAMCPSVVDLNLGNCNSWDASYTTGLTCLNLGKTVATFDLSPLKDLIVLNFCHNQSPIDARSLTKLRSIKRHVSNYGRPLLPPGHSWDD